MYKLSDMCANSNSSEFLELLKTRWDELHSGGEVFRYKLNNLEERLLERKYFLQLNPDRRAKRRTPEEMNNVCQPNDENKFNFTKVTSKEILFSIEGRDSDIHTVLVNVSPISRYHSLLCPSIYKCLPQIVTWESLAFTTEIMFIAQDRNLRILYNSLCGFASVNHLHYHIFVENKDFYVETVKWQPLKDNLYILDKGYPAPAFCFKIPKNSITQTSKEIYNVLDYLLKNSVAHNILLTRRCSWSNVDETVHVIVWPRRSTTGAKQFSAINVAVLELSGWFPVYDREDFMNLTADDLEGELLKWNVEDFDKLCENIKSL